MNKIIQTTSLLFLIALMSSLSLVSCKSKSAVAEKSAKSAHLKADKIIENYNNNKTDFSTLYIKSNVKYTDYKHSQNVSAEIKIKKDEQILISIRYLGFIVAKASITPTTVNYYEKISGEYFEGDFSVLSQFLGTNLDYNKIQNLFLGRAIDDLKKGQYSSTDSEQDHRLDDTSDPNTKKSFYFDSKDFLITKQEIAQTIEQRMVQIAYSNKKMYDKLTLPLIINIDSYQTKGKSEIDIEYNTVTFNEEISFPYSVPNGYKRIIIK